jgi:hypothetical protein
MAQFCMALNAVTRIGQKDFLVPGCPKDKSLLSRQRRKFTRKLDPAYVKDNLELLIAELLAERAISKHIKLDRIARTARDAAEVFVQAGLHQLPLEVQREYENRALRSLRKQTDAIQECSAASRPVRQGPQDGREVRQAQGRPEETPESESCQGEAA